MANIDEVQLPDGTNYNIVDSESGYQTEAQVDAKIGDKADKTLVSYCSCSTASATALKEVIAPEGWELEAGRIIAVKFVNTNTAQNPTLKVGDAETKYLYYNDAAVTTDNLFAAGEQDRVTLYMYDGTRFVWLGHSLDNNTTYEDMSAAELLAGTETAQRSVRADHLKTGIQNVVDAMGIKALKVSVSSVSSLPQTITNANITADMEVLNSVLSTPSAQTGDWTVTTSAGSATISGSISGSTNITLYLAKVR